MIKMLPALLAWILFLTGCGSAGTDTASSLSDADTAYGVFLGIEPEDISRTDAYETVVIDAQYFSAEQIAALHGSDHTVYSYLNIGSVENFRPYYAQYEPLTIGDYENWDEERWVDVSSGEWQAFILQ